MPVDFSHPNAQPFLLEAGDCALLLIHGFTGSPGHMRPVGEAVHAAGFTVRGIALPGHCQSIEAMEQSDWKQWLACCGTRCARCRRSTGACRSAAFPWAASCRC